MPTIRCQCGATYRFDDALAGQKSKCKHCQAVLTLAVIPTSDVAPPSTTLDIESDDDDDEIVGATLDRLIDKVVKKRGHARRDKNLDRDLDERDEPDTLVDAPTPARGYGQSLYWTLLFPTMPGNLAIFVIFWMALAIGQAVAYMPMIRFIGILLLVRCWYAGFQFCVLESATAGERDLPNVHYSADIYQELLAPLFKWFGSWFVALLPALLFIANALYQGQPLQINWSLVESGGPTGLVRGFAGEPVLLVLVCAGLALWPMIILTISLGGFMAARRIGHMIIVIFRSLPAYLVTLCIVGICIAGNTILALIIDTKVSVGQAKGTGNIAGSFFLQQVLIAGVRLYLDIVMLRAIGLYYHHFKHKFDFEWG